MPEQVAVYYEGWGERWPWGRLVSTTALGGRPHIVLSTVRRQNAEVWNCPPRHLR